MDAHEEMQSAIRGDEPKIIDVLEVKVRLMFEHDILRISSSEDISRDSNGKYVDKKIQAMWAGYALGSTRDWKMIRHDKDKQ